MSSFVEIWFSRLPAPPAAHVDGIDTTLQVCGFSRLDVYDTLYIDEENGIDAANDFRPVSALNALREALEGETGVSLAYSAPSMDLTVNVWGRAETHLVLSVSVRQWHRVMEEGEVFAFGGTVCSVADIVSADLAYSIVESDFDADFFPDHNTLSAVLMGSEPPELIVSRAPRPDLASAKEGVFGGYLVRQYVNGFHVYALESKAGAG